MEDIKEQDDFETLVGLPANGVAALAMRTFIETMKNGETAAVRLDAAQRALDMLEQMRRI